MPPGIEAALQADRGQIIAVMLLLTVPQFAVTLGAIIFWVVRSRTKVAEQTTVAKIDERAKREAADLEERRQINEAFRSVIRLVDNKDQQISTFAEREAELRKANEEFQRSYIALSDVRTGQLDKMTEGIKQQNETNEVVRDTITKAESEIRTHAERSMPAIEIVKELPTTLQRIEESLRQLDAQLKAIPVALKNEIEPLMKTVSDLKTNVEELSSEVKRVPEAIAPLVAAPLLNPGVSALPPELLDNARKTPPEGVKVPPFDRALLDTTGGIQETTPQ